MSRSISGREHITDVNGDCTPDCPSCEIEQLRALVDWYRAQNGQLLAHVERLRTVIENHRRVMTAAYRRTQDFPQEDRDLWGVLDE